MKRSTAGALSVALAGFLLFSGPAPCCDVVYAAQHEPFIRQCFQLAINAGKKGNHTYGALLVYQGKVILTAENTVNTDNDPFRHAEMNLLVQAKRELSPEVLRQSTMYTSAAPCMICCAAMRYRGVSKVVYGVSYKAFGKLTGYDDKSMPCNEMYRHTGTAMEWIGPILEEEGLQVLQYWPQSDPHSYLFRKN